MGLRRAIALAIAILATLPAAASGRVLPGKIGGLVAHRGGTPAAASPFAASVHIPRPVLGSTPLTWHGGPVMHSNTTHAIYWDPSGSLTPTYHSIVDGFFANVAADSGRNSNVYSTDPQYTDGSGPAAYASTYAGEIVDTTPYPANGCSDPTRPVCLTDSQLTTELDAVISAHHLPRGLGDIYFILTPSDVGTCIDSTSSTCLYNYYCAYHSDYVSGGNEVLYADIPYPPSDGCDAGQHPNGDTADATIDTISHEHNETITDPLGNAWLDGDGNEDGDKCDFNFGAASGPSGAEYNETIGGSHYYIQQEWNNAALNCVQRTDLPPSASFTSPGAATSGSPASFDASASADPDGTVASYAWDFGDGQRAAGVAPAHTYASAGSYQVTLTVTDNDGSTASATEAIAISAPPDRPPTCSPGSVATAAEVPVAITLACSDPDAGDSVTVQIATGPAHGILSAVDPATGRLTYTPVAGFGGDDSFSIVAHDSHGAWSAPAQISLAVAPATTRVTSAGAARISLPHSARLGRTRARDAVLTYSVTQAAAATFQLQRLVAGVRGDGGRCVRARGRRGRCRAYVRLGRPLVVSAVRGSNTLPLNVLLRGIRLARGTYRIVAAIPGGHAARLTLQIGR